MPRTQYFTATSVDGFIADPDNSLDWLFAADANSTSEATDAIHQRFSAFFEQVGAIAMGATTYEWMLAHEQLLAEPDKWPYGEIPCWVFSHRKLPEVPGARVSFATGDVWPTHKEMTAAAGDSNIWLIGGGDLVGQFADHGLLDEIILSIAPAFLGGGAPLLPRRLMPAQLNLAGCEQVGTFVQLTYAVRAPG
jgi:dihydrofolate reductase